MFLKKYKINKSLYKYNTEIDHRASNYPTPLILILKTMCSLKYIRSINPYANITLVFSVKFFKFSLVTEVSTCKHILHSCFCMLRGSWLPFMVSKCLINEWRIPSFTRQRKPPHFSPCCCLDAKGHQH